MNIQQYYYVNYILDKNRKVEDSTHSIPESDYFITINQTNDSKEITIPLRQGEIYDATVFWGDGSFEKILSDVDITHTYDNEGLYEVKIFGEFPTIYFNGKFNHQLKDIKQWGSVKWTSFNKSFKTCFDTVCSATDVPDLDLVSDFFLAFNNCSKIDMNINNWNLTNVTNFSYSFSFAKSFNNAGNNMILNLDNATSLSGMFISANKLNVEVLINANMSTKANKIFKENYILNKKITMNMNSCNDFSELFFGCFKLNILPEINTLQLSNYSSMFEDCYKFNVNINDFNLSKAQNLTSFLDDAEGFNNNGIDIDISLPEATNIYYLFANIDNLNVLSTIDIPKISKLEKVFYKSKILNKDISFTSTNNVTEILNIADRSNDFNSQILLDDTSKVDKVSISSFSNVYNTKPGFTLGNSLTNLSSSYWYDSVFNQDITTFGWDMSNVSSFGRFIKDTSMDSVNYAKLLIELSDTTTKSNVTMDSGTLLFDSSAQSARDNLVNNKGWTITDGGVA